jgi:23S rRNA pseudouridine1911/1915/1917 synthase
VSENDPTIGTRTVLVRPDGDGRRLDVYLSTRFPLFSRTRVQRLIRQGDVEIAGRKLKASSTLLAGEELFVTAPGLAPAGPMPPLPMVIFEDDRLVVVNKPAGMLAHPTGIVFAYGLVNVARAARPDDNMDLAHRLDRETSGINVLTKDRVANAFLKAAFKAKQIGKCYRAIVRGSPDWDQRLVDAPVGLATGSAIRIRRGVNPDGLSAQTLFTVEQRVNGLSLIRAEPRTGRTHQIRVHMEHLGFPILGDKMYGQPDDVFLHHLDHGADAFMRQAVGFPRHALHATQLTIPHPDGGTCTFEAPLTEDLAALLQGQVPDWPAPPEEKQV